MSISNQTNLATPTSNKRVGIRKLLAIAVDVTALIALSDTMRWIFNLFLKSPITINSSADNSIYFLTLLLLSTFSILRRKTLGMSFLRLEMIRIREPNKPLKLITPFIRFALLFYGLLGLHMWVTLNEWADFMPFTALTMALLRVSPDSLLYYFWAFFVFLTQFTENEDSNILDRLCGVCFKVSNNPTR